MACVLQLREYFYILAIFLFTQFLPLVSFVYAKLGRSQALCNAVTMRFSHEIGHLDHMIMESVPELLFLSWRCFIQIKLTFVSYYLSLNWKGQFFGVNYDDEF